MGYTSKHYSSIKIIHACFWTSLVITATQPGLLIFCTVVDLWISTNLQNLVKFTKHTKYWSVKFTRNCTKYIRYNIYETYLNGCLLALNLQIYCETLSLQRANNCITKLPDILRVMLQTTGHSLCPGSKKALPLVQFFSILLLQKSKS